MGGGANTVVAFKNCTLFITCRAHLNDVFVNTYENLDIAMPMYNLIEYSKDYSDTLGNL